MSLHTNYSYMNKKETHSYLDPSIQITELGAVSIVSTECSLLYSHTSILIEGVVHGELCHRIYSLEGQVSGNSLSARTVGKVSLNLAAIVAAVKDYGTNTIATLSYNDFQKFKERFCHVNAFSLWSISSERLQTLTRVFDEACVKPPPYSLNGKGKVEGIPAHNCFTFAREMLRKISIEATHINQGWATKLYSSASGDSHIGRIESASKNFLGTPQHLKPPKRVLAACS